MGQSQSLNEKNKRKPIKAEKFFGLIYYERKFDAVLKTKNQMAKEKHQSNRSQATQAAFKAFNPTEEDIKKWNIDNPGEKCAKMKIWNQFAKEQWQKDYAKDEKGVQKILENQKDTIVQNQVFADLNATYNDAQLMYNFMEKQLCKSLQDITIMSSKLDYKRLFQKPKYGGDFMKQLFDWNTQKDQRADAFKEIKKALIEEYPSTGDEQWDDFTMKTNTIKYSAKKTLNKQKKERIQEQIQKFKTFSKTEWKEKLKKLKEEIKQDLQIEDAHCIKNTQKTGLGLCEKQLKEKFDKLTEEKKAEMEKKFEMFYEVNFKLECHNFWAKQDSPRAQQLFQKMHPMLFLKSQVPAYEKIQQNWIFQYLSEQEKKNYIQTRKPKYLTPGAKAYDQYLEEIKKYAIDYPKQEIVSLQLFACHGAICRGNQICILNHFDKEKNYYEYMQVELLVRNKAVEMTNVYFLILFACCRESYIEGSISGEENKNVNQDLTRGTNGKALFTKPANFTLLFGCNPAEGVKADTKFVSCFIKHIQYHFDPEDGTVQIPECLSMVDSSIDQVKFESTSCNLGRNLTLIRQDNRVNVKLLFVVTEKKISFQNPSEEELKSIDKDTVRMVNFFKEELDFKDDQILYIHELEAKKIENILSQSEIFKTYQGEEIENQMKKLAHETFVAKGKCSNGSQLLTIFINESKNDDIRDFIVNRNPELALTVNWADKDKEREQGTDMIKYLSKLRKKVENMNQIRFENVHRFFNQQSKVVQFCQWFPKFQPGSGQFDIIFDLDQTVRKIKTIKQKFDYLEEVPVKQFTLPRHAFGCSVDKQQGKVLIVTINQNKEKYQKESDDESKIVKYKTDNKGCRIPIDKKTQVNKGPQSDKCELNCVIKAYYVYPEEQKNGQILIQKPRWDSQQIVDVTLEEIQDISEVHSLKMLYFDEKNKAVYFTIMAEFQQYLRIGKVSFKDKQKEKPKITIQKQIIVKEAERAKERPQDYDGLKQMLAEKKRQAEEQKKKSEEQQNLEETKNQQVNDGEAKDKQESNENQKDEEQKYQDVVDNSTWGTELEFFFKEQKAQEKLRQQYRHAAVLAKLPPKGWFRKGVETDFKLKVPRENIQVFATQDISEQLLLFYVLTNRRNINNRQSSIELEVFQWSDKELKVFKGRKYLREAVLTPKEKLAFREVKMKGDPKKYEITLNYEQKLNQDDGSLKDDDQQFEVLKEANASFFKKQPISFRQSTDDPKRLIFVAGNRANYVYDLRMFGDGLLKQYDEQEVENGMAIGLQNRAFVYDIDLIRTKRGSDKFFSFIIGGQEGLWKKDLKLLTQQDVRILRQSSIKQLPIIIKFPDEILALFKKLKKVKNVSDQQKKNEDDEQDDDYYDVKEEKKQKNQVDDKEQAENEEKKVIEQKSLSEETNFYFAIANKTISIVNETTGEENLIVHQRAMTDFDCLSNPFITYKIDEADQNYQEEADDKTIAKKKKESESKITLHYFENAYDTLGHHLSSTYNTFDLTYDFFYVLFTCGEILPSTKVELIKKIKRIEARGGGQKKTGGHLSEDQRGKIKEELDKKAKNNDVEIFQKDQKQQELLNDYIQKEEKQIQETEQLIKDTLRDFKNVTDASEKLLKEDWF